MYVAVANEIYSLDLSGSSWSLAYQYPAGTRINMLFYDELLAGTDLGLFGHNSITTVGIDQRSSQQPQSFALEQNYPNPFNPVTSISYVLSQAGYTRLTVHNVLGQQVAVLNENFQSPGQYSFQWKGQDISGNPVASGIYFYQLSVGSNVETRKMMLLK